MDQVVKKSIKDCIVSINIQPSLWPLKSLTPLYKAKKNVFKACLVGTLNLCLNVPKQMQKTRNQSDHPDGENVQKLSKIGDI